MAGIYFHSINTTPNPNDDFTGEDDSSPNIYRWELIFSNNGVEPTIQSNTARTDIPTAGSPGGTSALKSRFLISGDFSVTTLMSCSRGCNSGQNQTASVLRINSNSDPGDYAQVYYRHQDKKIFQFKIINSIIQQNNSINNTNNSIRFRITRSAGVWHTYYNNIGSWTELGSGISISSDDVFVRLLTESYGTSNPEGGADWDFIDITADNTYYP